MGNRHILVLSRATNQTLKLGLMDIPTLVGSKWPPSTLKGSKMESSQGSPRIKSSYGLGPTDGIKTSLLTQSVVQIIGNGWVVQFYDSAQLIHERRRKIIFGLLYLLPSLERSHWGRDQTRKPSPLSVGSISSKLPILLVLSKEPSVFQVVFLSWTSTLGMISPLPRTQVLTISMHLWPLRKLNVISLAFLESLAFPNRLYCQHLHSFLSIRW